MRIKNAILIAGPTASGKSALAIDLAERHGAIIVNADSMQVYDVLNVLTARPDPSDLQRVPHLLYGHVDPSVRYSVAAWLADVNAAIRAHGPERRYVFAGGTGLYFRALAGGLSRMPVIAPEIRERWRYRLAEEGSTRLHRLLWRVDPQAAETIGPADGQRIIRALEVHEATGKPITRWRNEPGTALVDDGSARKYLVMPERGALVQRIEQRFDSMVGKGAIEEVQRLLSRKLDPDLPSMKAIGVRELGAFLSGEITLDAAIGRAKAATRQYAKRQMTWFRNQMDDTWVKRP